MTQETYEKAKRITELYSQIIDLQNKLDLLMAPVVDIEILKEVPILPKAKKKYAARTSSTPPITAKSKMGRKMTPEVIKRIIKMRVDGMKPKDIALKVGCSASLVIYYIKKDANDGKAPWRGGGKKPKPFGSTTRRTGRTISDDNEPLNELMTPEEEDEAEDVFKSNISESDW